MSGGDGLTTQVNISNGDTVGFNFVANSGSEVNIGGGNISPLGFNIIGGDINLIGSSFAVGGVLLDSGLTIGQASINLDRNSILTTVFADGSDFFLDLGSVADGSRTFLTQMHCQISILIR